MQAHLSDVEKQNIVNQLEDKKLNQFELAVILEAKTRVEVREYLVSRKLISSDTYYCT